MHQAAAPVPEITLGPDLELALLTIRLARWLRFDRSTRRFHPNSGTRAIAPRVVTALAEANLVSVTERQGRRIARATQSGAALADAIDAMRRSHSSLRR